MAWNFADDDVQITDNAALTLPDGDWSMGGWVKLTSNAGTQSQYFMSWSTYSAAPSFNWLIYEASHANANRMELNTEDAGGNNVLVFPASTAFGTTTAWQHAIAVRTGAGVVTIYRNGSSFGSDNDASYDDVDVIAGNLFLGARSNGPSNRAFAGDMREWAKWDRALSTDEITALANGVRPWRFYDSLVWYLPMQVGGANGLYQDWGPNRLTVTNTGSTDANHPPTGLWTPRGLTSVEPQVVGPAAAIMNQMQGSNLGADLFDGALIV